MKVILKRDIARLGQRGEIKDVSDGYAINVLIRKGDALLATPAELAKWKQKTESQKHKKELQTNTFVQLVDRLRQEKLIIAGKKHDEKGQLFAQIKEADIAEAIFQLTSFSVSPKQIIISSHIKSLGMHAFELKQGIQKEKLAIDIR